MFYLYQSNRLESLAALFAGIQRVRPLESALAAEQIVVQSQGMRRYLSVYLARELGVAANLQFSLPAGLTWQLMQKLIPDIPALSPFSPEVMRWRLLDLFRSERFQTTSEFENVRSVLQSYLGSGESADYQLAGQLADIFDQYLVYRPQWIDAWQEGKLLGLGEDELWQAQLWRYLDDGNQSAPHRVALWEKLLSSLDKAHLPERFFVFGISTMAPMYLQLLQKISEHCDVFVFALNPSGQYWGNVIEAAQLLKGGDDADLSQTGHPLLASLGKQGRDFFDFLTEIGLEEQPVFEEVSDDTLLHCLQNDIQNLRMPSEHSRTDLLGDGSVRIVSAHSPLRELQILKDKLLRILHEHPDWQPHDIAVLTPNIEPYSPFIEAVFGQAQGGAQALPYSVSDVKLSRRQPLLYALEQTLDLLESRFEVDKVLPLLESGLVLRRFGLTADDLPLLHDTIAELNVHWGLDGTMRGAADNLFTWQQALERIVLGWMLPDDGSPLWQNVSAWHGDVNRLDVFGRFAAFIRTLSRLAAEWRKPSAAEEWTERCRDLVQSLFLPDADDQYALQQFEQALAKWQEETALAGFSGTLPQHTVIRHIRRFLGSESQAGFLRGGITFCSMVPMRSLPFNAICLLGLNDGVFPRQTKAASFDLIAKLPQAGDRARRDDDRYLFLEAVLSARHILYLSYIGRDIRTDAERAPSTLLGELVDCIASLTDLGSQYLMRRWVTHHPLQAFSPRYFQDESSLQLFSTRQDFADALNHPQAAYAPFANQAACTAEAHPVEQKDLLRFWRNPVRYWLKHHLNWQSPYFNDALPSSEPFLPDQRRRLDNAYLTARLQHQDFADTAARLKAQSLLPAGKIGELTAQDYAIRAAMLDSDLHSQALPHRFGTLHLGESSLHYQLQHNHADGQIFFAHQFLAEYNQHGKLAAADKIELLLHHLIYCAATPDNAAEPRQSQYIGLNQTCSLPPITQADAQEALKTWLTAYRIGQNTPLPYFARVNWAAATAYYAPNAKKQDTPPEQRWQDALGKAIEKYHGGFTGMAQEDYPEVKLVFGRQEDNTPPYLLPMFRTLTEQLFAPLAECLQAMKDV